MHPPLSLSLAGLLFKGVAFSFLISVLCVGLDGSRITPAQSVNVGEIYQKIRYCVPASFSIYLSPFSYNPQTEQQQFAPARRVLPDPLLPSTTTRCITVAELKLCCWPSVGATQ